MNALIPFNNTQQLLAGKFSVTFDADFGQLGENIKIFEIFREKKITSPTGYFSIENSLFKNIFGHNSCFCQSIFKFFVAHFTQI